MSEEYTKMKEVTPEDYREFIKFHNEIMVGKTKIKIGRPKRIKRFQPMDLSTPEKSRKIEALTKKVHKLLLEGTHPSKVIQLVAMDTSKYFELETTNVWSFPKRGKWATHQGNFRGN